MSGDQGRLESGSWNGLLNGNAMPFMPGFFGGAGGPDAAALAAAYAQLQQQQQNNPQFMSDGSRRFGGNRAAYPPDRSGVKKCGHCQVSGWLTAGANCSALIERWLFLRSGVPSVSPVQTADLMLADI